MRVSSPPKWDRENTMERQKIMAKLERLGIENDQAQSDKSKKYLNITRGTDELLVYKS